MSINSLSERFFEFSYVDHCCRACYFSLEYAFTIQNTICSEIFLLRNEYDAIRPDLHFVSLKTNTMVFFQNAIRPLFLQLDERQKSCFLQLGRKEIKNSIRPSKINLESNYMNHQNIRMHFE